MTRAHLRKLPVYAGGLLLMFGLAACGHKPAPAPPAPPPPAPAPLPTVSLNANPTAIQRGQTSTLTWTSDHAVSVTLNGTRVNLSGSQDVTPTESTDYEVVATNSDGKAANASVRVTVTAPPPPPPPPPPPVVQTPINELFKENVRDAYFNYDKSVLRADARQALTTDADWLKSHAGVDILIAGHCDARGSAEYNMGLGDRRADAARKFLIALGVDASRIRTISYGKEAIPGYPLCTASTSECYQQNRVDHISMQSNSGQ